MCTVTYIPQTAENSFVLTSNRDEKEFRPTIKPAKYKHGDVALVYPKDQKAGGSWIAMNNHGQINCLLNGGVVAHKKQEHHTKSRGIVLIEFSSSGLSANDFFLNKELTNVEPFTIVTIDFSGEICKKLTEFIWDGKNKSFNYPDKEKPHIWSSVTLYNEENRNLRKDWFNRFHDGKGNTISAKEIMGFHSGNHTKDNTINVLMQRDGGLKTVSITQVFLEGSKLKMCYSDLLKGSENVIEL